MLWALHAENHGQAGVPSASSAPSGQGRGESIQPCVAAWQVTSMASAFVIDLAVQDALHSTNPGLDFWVVALQQQR